MHVGETVEGDDGTKRVVRCRGERGGDPRTTTDHPISEMQRPFHHRYPPLILRLHTLCCKISQELTGFDLTGFDSGCAWERKKERKKKKGKVTKKS